MVPASSHRELMRLVAPLGRRVNLAVWLNQALFGVALSLGLYAVALILLKVLRPQWTDWSLLALTLLPASMVWAVWSARRRGWFFAAGDLVEVLDHLYKNDGAVTSAFERPELLPSPGFFQRVAEATETRRPRLDVLHYVRRLLPVLVLTVVSLVVPARPPAEAPQSLRVLTTLAQPVLEKLEQFEDILPEDEAEQLRRELEQLGQSPEGISREKWEALEEMRERVDEAVAQSRQSLAGLAGGLRGWPELAGQPSAVRLRQADANLSASWTRLNEAARDPKRPMSSQLRKEICDNLGRLQPGQPITLETMERLQELCQELSECLGEGESEGCESGEGVGRGGIDRGRGDAPLVLGDEKALPDGRYEESELFNRYLDPADLVDLGITPVEPKPDPGAFSPGVVRQFDKEQGSGVSRTRISPGRRDAISKYFAQPEE
ncbi:hypothetical protein HS125_15865 [bacterium]|nr:hypothetical protein [bacterium]